MSPLPDKLHISSASSRTIHTLAAELCHCACCRTHAGRRCKTRLDIALAMSQRPIQQGIGSVTHTLCIWAGAVGLWRRLVHEMQSHKAIVLVFHIYPFFPPLQGIIGSLRDRQQEAMLLCYQCVGMSLWHVANDSVAGGLINRGSIQRT